MSSPHLPKDMPSLIKLHHYYDGDSTMTLVMPKIDPRVAVTVQHEINEFNKKNPSSNVTFEMDDGNGIITINNIDLVALALDTTKIMMRRVALDVPEGTLKYQYADHDQIRSALSSIETNAKTPNAIIAINRIAVAQGLIQRQL